MGLLSKTQHLLPYNREALIPAAPAKEQDGLPEDRTTVLVIQSSNQASCSMLVIKHPPHGWDGGG